MSEPAASPLVWDGQGQPRSRLFDDVYYSREGGLAESRAVFLAGCGLPDAWAGRERFVAAELGFGTGLNVAALIDLWARTRPARGRLHIFTIEAHPLGRAEAAQALAAFPEIGAAAEAILARWPRQAAGLHRLALDDWGVILDVAHMDVAEALAGWRGAADAWFLDGFSPARNPAMWADAVLAAVASRSAPGARVATFTVAGQVRRGLQAQGFQVAKRPGFGAKRERLEACLPGTPAPAAAARPAIAIVGGGIAGAALARAFTALGAPPLVIEAEAPGAGASGQDAALVLPRLDAGGGTVARLYAQAFARAADLYDATPDAVIAAGALQLEAGDRDAGRFDRIAASALFEAGAVERLDAAAVSGRIGESVAAGGLDFRDARVVEPAAVLRAWLPGAQVERAHVAVLERVGARWRLLRPDGGPIAEADIVVLANGVDAARLAPALPLSPVRGQASAAALPGPAPLMGAGFVIPTRTGLLFGATHDRGEAGADLRAGDDARNLAQLAAMLPALAARLAAATRVGRAGVRATTPDFLPLVGATDQPGLFVLAGLGSRGFCAAPLLAEQVAADALAAPAPLPAALAAIVHPDRFVLRRQRRLAHSREVQGSTPS